MKFGAWPRPITGQDCDHVLELGDGRIFCGHSATANRLDCLDAGVVGDFAELSSTNLAWVGGGRRHQGGQDLWKVTKEIKLSRQPLETAACDCAADNRSSRGADDDVGHFVRHALGIEAVCKTEHPGSEILAATTKHQSSVFAFSERWIGRNRKGEIVTKDDFWLGTLVACTGLRGCDSRRKKQSGSCPQHEFTPSDR